MLLFAIGFQIFRAYGEWYKYSNVSALAYHFIEEYLLEEISSKSTPITVSPTKITYNWLISYKLVRYVQGCSVGICRVFYVYKLHVTASVV
jgi:hypothetical protein